MTIGPSALKWWCKRNPCQSPAEYVFTERACVFPTNISTCLCQTWRFPRHVYATMLSAACAVEFLCVVCRDVWWLMPRDNSLIPIAPQ